jgi:integrase
MSAPRFHLKQLPSGEWRARKRRKGHPDLYFNTETTDKKLAEKRADAWIDQLIAEKFGEAPKLTFGEAAERFAADHFPTLRPKTSARYAFVLCRFVEDWDALKIDQIDSAVLASYETRRRKDVEPQTIGFEFRILSVFFEYCNRLDFYDGNPARSYMKKRGSKVDIKRVVTRKRYLSHSEEKALLGAASEEWRNRIIFAIETGLRREEQFSLLRRDVDMKAGVVKVRAEIAKNGRARKVPLTSRAGKAARAMMSFHSLYVCSKRNGQRVVQDATYTLASLKRIAATVGIEDLRWHDLRRTCGVRRLRDHGNSMEEVQLWLGHEDIRVTQQSYSFLDEEDLAKRVQEVELERRLKKLRGTARGTARGVQNEFSEENQVDD